MYCDYHMHLEKGSYSIDWIKEFIATGKENNVSEIGFSEHTHGYIEFKDLYYDELILDNSFIGNFQRTWLTKNKFKNYIYEYQDFIKEVNKTGENVKIAMEVCNFNNQKKVQEILNRYEFDYLITSIHFLDGWGFDASYLKEHFNQVDIDKLYERYVEEIERLANENYYDILGHPFNLRLFKNFPTKDITHLLHRACRALKKANMAIDCNTGTYFRYPIKEISPFSDFLKLVFEYDIPIILSSDAHQSKDVGKGYDMLIDYVKEIGYTKALRFSKRKREFYSIWF